MGVGLNRMEVYMEKVNKRIDNKGGMLIPDRGLVVNIVVDIEEVHKTH